MSPASTPVPKATSVPDTTAETAPVEDGAMPPEGDGETVAADGGDGVRRRRRPSRTVVSVVLAIVVIALGVVFAFFAHAAAQRDDAGDQRGSALAAARQAAVNFTSYDYRHLDQDYQRVRDEATGAFRTDFDKQSKVLAQLIQQSKAVAKGQVVDAALVTAGSGAATVLVAVDDTITNTQAPKGVVKHYRLRIDLKKVGGSWRVADVQPVA